MAALRMTYVSLQTAVSILCRKLSGNLSRHGIDWFVSRGGLNL